ncbi:M23 family metallopeptidase [Brevundimonas goettingensis]|uniref:M23 family metallopeptidase n=1 Tax=Brevundimonas goettingensis TaxID=2774190 RepID=A0A975GZV4_9CAUL|nr:M23 family metallopeptidase [Brevundimonas goettingensis]QTC93025.1 M23 family metallopeptidase [Brevundimonas goettingensis]
MRRLAPATLAHPALGAWRGHLVHTGRAVGLAVMACLAMAAAPFTPKSVAEAAPLSGVSLVKPPVVAIAAPAGPMMRQMVFAEPVPGHGINSKFGMRRLGGEPGARMHKGVDIAAPTGTSVYATGEGVVLRIGYDPAGYGNFIEMRHPNGLTSLYGHLSRVDVASGDAVGPRQRIGLVGSTGYSTGPHLHFEVRREGAQVNPAKVIGRAFQVKAG